MASPDLIRWTVKSVVDSLKDKKLGFGDKSIRTRSYYAWLLESYRAGEGELRFSRYVWDKAVTAQTIPAEADWIEVTFSEPQTYPDPEERPQLAATELLGQNQSFRDQLELITNNVDLYAAWAEALRAGTGQVRGLEELTEAVTNWARVHLPNDCLQRYSLVAAVDRLMDDLRRKVAGYRFDGDFLLSWMIPNLNTTMLSMLESCRPEIVSHLRQDLVLEAKRILDVLYDACGIYDLDAGKLVDQGLAFVMTVDPAEYNQHKEQLHQWALQVIKENIRLEASFYCQPQLDMRYQWGTPSSPEQPRIEAGELKMRQAFLQKYLSII